MSDYLVLHIMISSLTKRYLVATYFILSSCNVLTYTNPIDILWLLFFYIHSLSIPLFSPSFFLFLPYSLPFSLFFTNTHTQTHTRIHKHAHTLLYSLSLMHTHTQSHSFALPFSRTLTHTLYMISDIRTSPSSLKFKTELKLFKTI